MAPSVTGGPDYAIIVPAYNEEGYIRPTLARLQACMGEIDGYAGELIVVDNDSTDGTATLVREMGVRVVHEAHRQIARARNAGAAASSARFLIFVDADTLITTELLRHTLATLTEQPICYGGTAVIFDQPVTGFIGASIRSWNRLSRTMTWACGAYVFCRREAFEEVGGFDEKLYAAEEIRLCRKLRQWGRRHGMRGVILKEPIVTSMRKAEWFSTWRMVKMVLMLAVMPYGLRRRDACWLWYERPEKKVDPPQ